MNWKKAFRLSGFLGATVCGVCLAKTYSLSQRLLGSVSAAVEVNKSNEGEQSDLDLPCRQGEMDCGVDVAYLKLKQVHVYFRHGARTPLHLAPGLDEVAYYKDFLLRTPPHFCFQHVVALLPDLIPKEKVSEMEEHYKKTTLKGGGYAGNLTTYGQEQVYELGYRLRQCYIERRQFLNPCYDPKEVYVQSTNIDRTIASARCVLAGLFGKHNLEKKGPVVIPVSLLEDEVLLPKPSLCPVIKKVNHAAMIHYDNIPGIKEDRLLIQEMLCLGPEPEKKIDFIALRDDLIARTAHGYPYPEKLLPYRCMIERNATKLLYFAMCGQNDRERVTVTRLAGGPALHLAYSEMTRAVNGEMSVFKIHLYSTHDSTMMPLLEALGIFDWQWPPFAADLRIELYEDDSYQSFVRVLYCGEVKTIKGFIHPVIPWDDFKKRIEPYVIERGGEYDAICASNIIEECASSLLHHDHAEKADDIAVPSKIPAGM